MHAKEKYLSELAVMTVYDVKSSIEATFYGLPMYQVQPTSSITLRANATVENIVGNVDLTTIDSASDTPTVSSTHTLASVTTANGTYYTMDGESQATAGRPIQPKIAFAPSDRHTYSGTPPPVHGILLRGGTYTDVNPNDTVFARPTLEWEKLAGEYQECLDGFAPAENALLNSLETAGGLIQTVALTMGQFKCTNAGPPVTGIGL